MSSQTKNLKSRTTKEKIKHLGVLFFSLVLTLAVFSEISAANPKPTTVVGLNKADWLYYKSSDDITAYLGKKSSNLPSVRYQKGDIFLEFSLTGEGKAGNSSPPSLETDTKKPNTPTLFYRNILDGIDMNYQITNIPFRVKEEIVLKQPKISNLKSKNLTYAFDVSTNALPKKQQDGSIHFYDNKGNYLFQLDKPFMVDAKGNRSEDVSIEIISVEPGKSQPAPVTRFGSPDRLNFGNFNFISKYFKLPTFKSKNRQPLSVLGPQQYTITLSADSDWLSTASYPVVIDPTITHNADSNFTGQFNRIVDNDSTSSTQLEKSYGENTNEPYTVLNLHFNETSGSTNIKDYASTTRVITANGNASTTNYVTQLGMGNSAAFDGTGDYLSAPDDASLDFAAADNFSIDFWFKHNTISTNADYAVTKADATTGGYKIYMDVSGDMCFDIDDDATWTPDDSACTSGIDYDNDVWHHVAGIKTGTSKIELFMDGVLVASDSALAASGTLANTNGFYIGMDRDGLSNGWDGYVDEARVVSRALTPEEIKAAASRRPYAVYTSQVLGPYAGATWNTLSWNEGGMASTTDGEMPYDTTNLLAKWDFNETSGTTATSSAGTCQDCAGTLTNFADTSAQDVAAGTGWTANNKRWGAGGLMLDGVNDFINAGSSASLDDLGPLTYTAWIWPAATSSTSGELMGKQSTGYATFGVDYTQNRVYFTKDYSGVNLLRESATNTLKIAEWNHVAVTWDDSATAANIKFYINGKETAYSETRNGTGSQTSDASGNFNIGRGSNSSYQFKGIVDSASVYSRALSASEILANYHATNIEFQTRTGASSDPNDGTWEAWKPITGETQLLSMDSDAANWNSDIMASTTIATSTDTVIKMEGTGSLKVKMGMASTTANTVALWHFEETGTTTSTYLYDETANNNDATTTGTTVADGIFGKARKFNGASDHLRALDSASWDFGTGDFTVDAWINSNALVGGGSNWAIIGDANSSGAGSAGWLFLLDRTSPGNLYFNAMFSGSWAINVGAAHGMSVGTWNHVAVTRSGTTVTLYVNGRSVGSGTNDPATNITSSRTLYIGADDGGMYFNGSIDEARVIKGRALSADEIAETYRMGANHHLTRQVSATDMSSANKLAFNIASDRPGTYLEAMLGESDHANYELASSTLALSTTTVLYIKGDEIASSTSIKDSSISPQSITTNGNARISGFGKIGNSLYFDGAGDYVITPNQNSFSNGFTLEAWVYLNSLDANNQWIVGDGTIGGDYWFTWITATTNKPRIYCWPDAVNGTSVFQTGKWYHVVGTCDFANGGTMNLYVNGVLEGTGTKSQAMHAGGKSNNAISVGNDDSGNGNSYYFDGYIDEVRVFKNTILTADQIRQAYEYGLRSHQITIDFGATLQPSDLISNSTDYNFSITATTSGLSATTSGLYLGDKVVIKENLGGTEYTAQGTVNAINATTGAITVPSWDSGSTFPSGNGYSPNATVFKWQREYFDISGSLSAHRDAVTNLTIRPTNGGGGRTIWLDDFRYNTNYLTASSSSAITSSANSYLQYRTIFSSWDSFVSPFLTSVSTAYTISVNSFPPSTGVSGGGFLSF